MSLVGRAETGFRRIHDNGFIAGGKRLYMTATPRIYTDRARRKAAESNLTAPIASMDDEDIYGPELHRLGFGKAVDKGILSPYRVVILDVDMERVGADLDDLLSAESTEIDMGDASTTRASPSPTSRRRRTTTDWVPVPRWTG